MPENDMDDLERSLREIRASWAAGLPQRMADIGDALARCEAAPGDRGSLVHLQGKLHMLSGSAGSFGFAELGMRATELELLLNAYMAGEAQDFGAIAAGVRQLLDQAAPG